MTDTFTASNGVTLHPHDSRMDVNCSGSAHPDGHKLSVKETEALREFFQHERDEELGRWRWPDNPQYVVYPRGDSGVRVLRETGMGDLEWVDRGDERSYEFCHAARAYFGAHPERKPWHAPDAGDHWALHIAHGMALSGDEHLYKYTRWGSQGRWGFVPTDGGSVLDPTDPTITAGRRIWPEDAA